VDGVGGESCGLTGVLVVKARPSVKGGEEMSGKTEVWETGRGVESRDRRHERGDTEKETWRGRGWGVAGRRGVARKHDGVEGSGIGGETGKDGQDGVERQVGTVSAGNRESGEEGNGRVGLHRVCKEKDVDVERLAVCGKRRGEEV
jgi:hypothetical protein